MRCLSGFVDRVASALKGNPTIDREVPSQDKWHLIGDSKWFRAVVTTFQAHSKWCACHSLFLSEISPAASDTEQTQVGPQEMLTEKIAKML